MLQRRTSQQSLMAGNAVLRCTGARLHSPSAQGFPVGSSHAPWRANQSLVQLATVVGKQQKQQQDYTHHRLRCPEAAAGDHAVSEAADSINRFYRALNKRDIAAITSCLSEEVMYENLAIQDSLLGQQPVSRFYEAVLATMPDNADLQVDQVAAGDASRAAVVWTVVLPSSQTPLSRGISFYTLDPSGRISNVTECHAPAVKMSHQQLLVMGPLVTPLVKMLAEPVLPAVQEVSRAVQQGVDTLLQPLSALSSMGSPTPQGSSAGFTQPTPSSNSSSTFAPSATPAQQRAPSAAATQASGTVPLPQFSDTTAGQRAAARVAAAKQARLSAAGKAAPTTAAGKAAPTTAAPGRTTGVTGTSRMAVSPTAAAAAAGSPSSSSELPAEPVNLSGVWVKDAVQSDAEGYEATLDVLGLSGLQKVTARLIEGIEVQQSSTDFTVSFITVVPFFKVTEKVPLNGGETQLNRRDLRPGKQKTAARTVPAGVLVEMSWGPPLAGSLTELYSLLPNGCLSVKAETSVGQKRARSVTVYTRTSGSRDAVLADSRRRNGSVTEVLQRQRDQGLSM